MQGIITHIERLNNTVNGNPRFKLTIETESLFVQGVTASDAGFTYSMPRYEGDKVEFEFHRTKGGKVIFDSIEKA